MKKNNCKIVIIGAGISGLATAHWLAEDGFDLTVLEKKTKAGGTMETVLENGFLVDYGPNSGLETSPLIAHIAKAVGLEDEMIYASETSSKRYILRNNKIHALPTSPLAFLKTKLFSLKAKLRLLGEPFIGKSEDGYYQSISEFVKRRLGQEFLDYAINPFVAGVFAGNPDHLSVKSAFPKLYRLEELYGGLIKGMIKGFKERASRQEQSKQSAKMFSFKNGMQRFPQAIAEKLGDKVKYNCDVQNIVKSDDCYKIAFSQNNISKEITADIILSTIPAYETAKIYTEFDDKLVQHLTTVYYPPVKVLYLGFKKQSIGQALDGFGFLIPEKEKKTFLGAIFNSVIFSDRAGNDMAAFTLFIGGARSPELIKSQEQSNTSKDHLNGRVLQEFKKIMKIEDDPVYLKEKIWPRAIPQYNTGYIEKERYFDEFEKKNPGLFLGGNYRGGISVGDCILSSKRVYEKIITSMAQ